MEPPSAGVSEELLDELDLDSSLPAERKDEIVTELESYDGPDAQEVDELIEQLEYSGGTYRGSKSSEGGDISLLQWWADDPEKLSTLLETMDGYTEFASTSIQTFARHPYVSAPPIWLQDNGAIKYRVDREKENKDIFISDYRFKPRYGFKLIIRHDADRCEVANISKGGHIIEYRNEAGRIGSRIRLSGILDWIVPDKRILEEIPSSSEMCGTRGITEYEGEGLEPIRTPVDVETSNLVVGEVDRISSSGNPVVETGGGHFLVDRGESGKIYLINMMSSNRGRALSRFPD